MHEIQQYSYPDKLGFAETLMFHLRVMSKELATDGMDKEFEDLVDFLCLTLWPFIDEHEKYSKKYKELENDGDDLSSDKIEMLKRKRKRISDKLKIAMSILQDKGLLLKRVPIYEQNFNPDDYMDDFDG